MEMLLKHLCITVYVWFVVYVTLPPGIRPISVGNKDDNKYTKLWLQSERSRVGNPIRWKNSFHLPNPSGRTGPFDLLGL
jgi:hypothetical protein